MGWWGTEILAGDTPLDMQGKLYDMLVSKWNEKDIAGRYHFEMEPDERRALYVTSGWCFTHIREKLMAWNRECRARMDSGFFGGDCDVVALQVMGWFVLEHDIPMRSASRGTVDDNREILRNAIHAAELELGGLPESGWNDPAEREKHLLHFIACCQAGIERKQYDLTAGEDDGLLASMADKMGA